MPESGIAHLYLSKCQLEQKNPQAAQESYHQATKLDDKLKDVGYWIDIQNGLCQPMIEAGEFDRAIALYENVLKELDGFRDSAFSAGYYRPRVRVSMAEVYHKAGRLDRAIEIYEEILSKKGKGRGGFGFWGSQDGNLYRQLATIYREKGDERKAVSNEQEASRLERGSKIFLNMVSCGMFTILLGVAQFLLVLAACIYLGIRILMIKKRKGISGTPVRAPVRKVSWGFQDVLATYAKAYFSPLALILLVFVIAAACGSDPSGLFFRLTFVVPFLIAMLSLILYWTISKKRFEVKFSQAYPDTKQEAIERPASVISLTLWQLLCVGSINIVFLSIAYGAMIAMVARGSL